jgi:hypothetical protein
VWGFGPTLAQIGCDRLPEMVHPAPDCFIGDRNAAFRQQIFDIAEAQGEPKIEPDCLMNDLGRELVSVVADFLHRLGYRAAKEIASPKQYDNAPSPHRLERLAVATAPRYLIVQATSCLTE